MRRHCVLNLPDRLELAAIVALVADATPANRTRVDDAALITPWRWRRRRFGRRRRCLHCLMIFFVSPNLRQKIVRRPLQGRVYPKACCLGLGGGAEVRKTAKACRLWYQKGSERHDPGGRLRGAHLWTAAAALSTSGQAHTDARLPERPAVTATAAPGAPSAAITATVFGWLFFFSGQAHSKRHRKLGSV